jgi:serine/threonine protein kinase
MVFITLYKLQDKLQDYLLMHPILQLQQSLLQTDNKKASFLGREYVHKQSLDRFLIKGNHDEHTSKINRDAIDLISRLLVYDPKARLTTAEALEHQFFAICTQFIDPSIINHPRDVWNNLPISIRLG